MVISTREREKGNNETLRSNDSRLSFLLLKTDVGELGMQMYGNAVHTVPALQFLHDRNTKRSDPPTFPDTPIEKW